jgi:hypothetical protein
MMLLPTDPSAFLSIDQLQSRVPAAFANNAADFVSDKYTFVRTADIIEDLYAKNWVAVAANQSHSFKSDPLVQKHSIVFRQADAHAEHPELGSLFSALRMTNSHNHTSKVTLANELLRLICGNGMIVSSGSFGSYEVRHDQITEDLREVMNKFESTSVEQMNTAKEWSETHLKPWHVRSFLIGASKLRFGEKSSMDKTDTLGISRREEDTGSSLWALFNRVQENGMRGGSKSGDMKRKTRSLTNIDAQEAWNRGLRDIAFETRALALQS